MKLAKHYLFIVACIIAFAINANAQTPQFINYQAIARDASGSILSDQPIGVQLTINDGSPTGTTQYNERQTVTTNNFGLFNLQIGNGTPVSGTMGGITWSSGPKYLLVGIDPTGGTSYVAMGSQQLISVPYSFYADNAANAANLTGTVTMGADVTGTNSAATVVKLQGSPVSAAAPAAGQVLQWASGAWTPSTLTGTVTMGGDVTGTNSAATVAKLQGSPVSAAAPATGQVLQWASGAWTPSTLAGTVTMGGDVTGTSSAATVAKLQGSPVSATAPAAGQVLQWAAGAWTPSTPTGTVTMGGDVTGTSSAAPVVSLQGSPVSATAPAAGQVLQWASGAWTPSAPPAAAWNLTGNAGTAPATNFVGTTDPNALRFRVNNTWAGEISLSGASNASYGLNAGSSFTSGNSNTAMGAGSLQYTTGGYSNTACGYQSLDHNTTGYYNTAMGQESLDAITTGNQNTALGYKASPGLAGAGTSFTNWTGIGAYSGGFASSGNSVELGNSSVSHLYAEVSLTVVSDGRIKDNIKANVPGLDFINLLRPVTYNLNIHRQNALMGKDAEKDWEGKYDIEKKTMSGFIAQEVGQAAKAAGYDFSGVDQPSGPNGLYGIRYSDFVPSLVKAVQEQQQLINNLQNQVEALLKTVQDMENKK